MIMRWVVGVALLFGILLLMLPKTDEESLSRIATASMLVCTSDLRDRVAQAMLNGEAVNEDAGNPCPDLIAGLEVSALGEIRITGNRHPITMTLSPHLDGAELGWRCMGEPAVAVTRLCKS